MASRKIERLDFVVAGAQKCGTTALHYFLEQHPQIALPDQQELHFFDDDKNFSEAVNYEALHAHFRPRKSATVSGENSPSYLYWKPAMERIRNYRRDIRIIILLRNPAQRAFSHWNMQRERGFEPLDFLDALRAENDRQQQARPSQSRRFSYVDRGLYSEQLKRVFDFFPREQVHVIKFEDFRREQAQSMAKVFEFLGVDPSRRLRLKQRNLIAYARVMTDAEARFVCEIFREEIPKVENLLGWDCSDWKNFRPSAQSS